jgi:hypothetical protein
MNGLGWRQFPCNVLIAKALTGINRGKINWRKGKAMGQNQQNYRIDHRDRECDNCKYLDSIKEPILHEDKGKYRIYICQLSHEPVDRYGGICGKWKSKNGR